MSYPAIGSMAIPSALLIQNPAPPVANQKTAVLCYKRQDTKFKEDTERCSEPTVINSIVKKMFKTYF
jgi:hypothetical protein